MHEAKKVSFSAENLRRTVLAAKAAGFGVLAMVLVWKLSKQVVPNQSWAPIREPWHRVMGGPHLLRLSVSIALLHVLLSLLFMALPFQVRAVFEIETAQVWKIYLPIFLCALLCLRPALRWANPLFRARHVLQTLSIVLGLSTWVLLSGGASRGLIWVALVIFFTSFNVLEAVLPSLVSRLVPQNQRGMAMGVYSTAQFFGIFLGGTIGGGLLQTWGTVGIQYGCLATVFLWLMALQGWSTASQSFNQEGDSAYGQGR